MWCGWVLILGCLGGIRDAYCMEMRYRIDLLKYRSTLRLLKLMEQWNASNSE